MADILGKEEYDPIIYMRFGFFFLQTLVVMLIVTRIDSKKCHGFRGKDNRQQTVERVQLDEHDDVKEHRALTEQDWDKG